jgi:hypothetical protein
MVSLLGLGRSDILLLQSFCFFYFRILAGLEACLILGGTLSANEREFRKEQTFFLRAKTAWNQAIWSDRFGEQHVHRCCV